MTLIEYAQRPLTGRHRTRLAAVCASTLAERLAAEGTTDPGESDAINDGKGAA